MFAFARFFHPGAGYYLRLLRVAPVLLLNRLGMYPSERAKERLLMSFFRGTTREHFERKGDEFGQIVLPGLVRRRAMKEIEWHRDNNAVIVVVTASLAAWCREWCRLQGLELIATQYESVNNIITGKLQGKNCKGSEKVRRIREKYGAVSAGTTYAYGDTKSDLPMLELADVKYYKWRQLK
jgi:HAD superfamily phosphoserine phosphatase-like hydrolase